MCIHLLNLLKQILDYSQNSLKQEYKSEHHLYFHRVNPHGSRQRMNIPLLRIVLDLIHYKLKTAVKLIVTPKGYTHPGIK